MKKPAFLTQPNTFRFVLILGLVNLFADMTYEGASSINGQFWSTLGASIVLWGIRLRAQNTLLKSLIASVLPEGRRNLAFGLFHTGYEGRWLIGNATTGLLYQQSPILVVAFSMAIQLPSPPIFLVADMMRQS
jgi:hypothetical protein